MAEIGGKKSAGQIGHALRRIPVQHSPAAFADHHGVAAFDFLQKLRTQLDIALRAAPLNHFGNCHAGPTMPFSIEVNSAKQVVWTYSDFERFGNSTVAVDVVPSVRAK